MLTDGAAAAGDCVVVFAVGITFRVVILHAGFSVFAVFFRLTLWYCSL